MINKEQRLLQRQLKSIIVEPLKTPLINWEDIGKFIIVCLVIIFRPLNLLIIALTIIAFKLL